jgi:hypothetical protein
MIDLGLGICDALSAVHRAGQRRSRALAALRDPRQLGTHRSLGVSRARGRRRSGDWLGVAPRAQARPAADSRRSRVVGISAEADEQDIAAWRALGVVDFVPKDNSFVAPISSIVAELRHR